MSNQVYRVKAKITREGIEGYWLDVGTATQVSEGKIILTLDALPLHSNGVMMLYPVQREVNENEQSNRR